MTTTKPVRAALLPLLLGGALCAGVPAAASAAAPPPAYGGGAVSTLPAMTLPALPPMTLSFTPPRVGPISVAIGAIIIGGKTISPGVNVTTPPMMVTPIDLTVR